MLEHISEDVELAFLSSLGGVRETFLNAAKAALAEHAATPWWRTHKKLRLLNEVAVILRLYEAMSTYERGQSQAITDARLAREARSN